MLFIFDGESRQGIWMQNMLFAIDVLWLDSKSRIVSMERNLQPCQSMFGCKTYTPEKGSKYVIELKAGTIAKNRIKLGSKVQISV